jgi:hypothetical protein
VRSRLSVFFAFVCLTAVPSFAQKPVPPPNPSIGGRDFPPAADDQDSSRERVDAEMVKKAAKERALAIKNDTDKLVKLSMELKESVDKSGESVLSLDVIKKAEEIEKLAKSVRAKMKGPN